MQAKLANFWGKTCLILFFTFLGLQLAMAQDAQAQKEITNAIDNAKNGEYQQAIPVLKKYADAKGFDDLTILQINVYLNFCYLATKNNEALNVDRVNKLADSYLEKSGISKTDSIKRQIELGTLFFVGAINTGIAKHEKLVHYFLLIKKIYEEENLAKDDGFYCETLRLLTRGYFNLKDYKSAIDLGELAWKANFELQGEKNNSSLELLDILYLSYKRINELEKSLEYLQKEIDVGKEFWGEENPDYLIRLSDLAAVYSNLGNFKKALEIDLKVVEVRKKILGEKSPDYIKSLNSLALAYSNNGEDQRALEICQNVVELSRRVLGERHAISLNCLNNLSSIYLDTGNYPKALETNLKVVELSRVVLGENHPDYAKRLGSLALVYSKKGEYQKALEINLKVVELLRKNVGEKSPDYLTCLSNLAVVYSKLGDYKKALEIDINIASVRKEVFGDKHPDYLTSLANLASMYSLLGNYKKALEIAQDCNELFKEVLGEKHPAYITSLSNLAQINASMGNYRKALEINLKAVAICKENFGESHPTYLASQINLAARYSSIGDYQKALEIYENAEKLYLKTFGSNHPNYLNCLGGLSSIYLKLGDYQKALNVNIRVTESRKKILGEKHPDYLTSLSSLGSVYMLQGDYLKALEINLKTTSLLKEVLGETHPDYLTSISNQALIYYYIGDYKNALKIDLEVLELQKKILGEKHPFILVTMNNLSLVYSETRKYQQALEISQEAVNLSKETLGERHPGYLNNLATLATIYFNLGEYKKALEINLQVTNVRRDVLGESHPDYLTGLGNLASDYSRLGDYSMALEINREVTNSIREVLGEKNPNYATCLIDLAISEYHLAQRDSALNHYTQMIGFTQEKLKNYFSEMTEFQRLNFWEKSNSYFERFPLFLEEITKTHPEGVSNAYNIALFSKGLLLNTSIDFNKLIAEKGSPEAKAKFEEQKLLRLQIQRLQEKPVAERYLNVDSLENIAQQKETELVKISKEYGDYTRNLKINWQDVQANLKNNDVAIEFVEYPTLTDTVKYAALVLRRGWQYPQMISLFRKDQIDEFIRQDKGKIYSNGYVGKQIRQLVWEPLEKVVSPGERVYFSPAGIYHQLAIENLAASDSTTLGDIYQMYRLSSTKELVTQTAKSKYKTAVLYGGLQYDLDSAKMVAESKKYPEVEKLLAFRGYSNDTTVRKGWEYLGGTLQEVEQINRLMNDRQYLVTEYTGETGNEESFKALSGKSPEIIHIATHGFFQPVEESRKNPFMQMRMGDQPESGGVDPMLRSGLMLSGGNKAWQGEKIPENIEDGVLTAREISRMDLRGTDLVVLSACETGLGEVSSEGVFGLQRSFKQAGVKNLIMSLWEVSDQATSFMMKEFYTNLLSSEDLRKAFVDAKQKCKEKYQDPQYWAAFVLLN